MRLIGKLARNSTVITASLSRSTTRMITVIASMANKSLETPITVSRRLERTSFTSRGLGSMTMAEMRAGMVTATIIMVITVARETMGTIEN